MLRNNYYKILYRKYKPTTRHTLNLSFKREGDCFLIRLRSLRFSSFMSRRNSLSSFPLYLTLSPKNLVPIITISSRERKVAVQGCVQEISNFVGQKFPHKPRDTVKRVYGSRHAVDTLRINCVRFHREISC